MRKLRNGAPTDETNNHTRLNLVSSSFDQIQLSRKERLLSLRNEESHALATATQTHTHRLMNIGGR